MECRKTKITSPNGLLRRIRRDNNNPRIGGIEPNGGHVNPIRVRAKFSPVADASAGARSPNEEAGPV